VHLEATADEEVLIGLRRAWPGALIRNPVVPMGPKQADRTAADHWLGVGADLISFGRACIANPDLVERLRTGVPIAPSTRTRTTKAATRATSPTRRTSTPPESR
jgi:N-ethylmaleimide reductase